ncbi:MAG: TonB-dependent receptor plug domain-containing protein [Bacteroidetes bacterium]|nr:TonB-dependent receptor plug domain-containing protein [Bacteroidota bacterium]
MRVFNLLFPVLCISLLFVSCSGTKSTTSQKDSTQDDVTIAYGKTSRSAVTGAVQEIEPDQPNLTLADYLRRVPGVSVRGTGDRVKVVIRDGITSSGTNEPLYVINNVPSGNSYSMVSSMVDVNDIKNISVLKDAASSSIYGYQAQHGVIIIETKTIKRRN